ncbi:ankyrin repeat-containing protein P16F5.05c isoform X1 [Vitis riparia]|uniref:ankyrin repeat-containing protein P16F5.05c isoform X1 n=1 Tax=Vitis riparia TaxID=96939 RepID=UPI00155B26D5|nr:ankyrin repeat-containing protein P16F5.05c isoform X1 [Vitis riparia]
MPSEEASAETAPQENVEALLEVQETPICLFLLSAARYDDIDDVKLIAYAGVSLDSKDSQGRTALHMAAANGHLDVVEFLISSGVDLNASNVEKNTPLHWACLNGHIEVVKNLILAGANVTALNSHERTPMDEAVSRGKMDVIDAINAAVAQVELTGIGVSETVENFGERILAVPSEP